MAASDALLRRLLRALARLLGLLAGLFGGSLGLWGAAKAATLPEDRAEALLHVYKGGGVTAQGPALLVRKSIADRVSLNGSVYVDAVSNASVDVVTTASPYRERRTEYGIGADYAVRDALLSFGMTTSREPDYRAEAFSVDVSQETYGGMTTVALGFTRAADRVGQTVAGSSAFFDRAHHWQYRIGLTQILAPRWLASLNFEAVSDDGYLGNPYRAARVFGAFVPERMPRTRHSRALKLRASGDLGSRDAVRAEYRYFWDTWAIKAHTVEGGYSRYFGERWLADAFVRWYTQSEALFYSDNASTQQTYVSRNRQLSDFDGLTLGGKLSWDWKKQPGRYDLKAHVGAQWLNYRYGDYTDLRSGGAYRLNAALLQLYLSATY